MTRPLRGCKEQGGVSSGRAARRRRVAAPSFMVMLDLDLDELRSSHFASRKTCDVPPLRE
eukprot:scaffold124663_cov18-Tisochrysis_lutea.AAC.1